VTPWHIVTSEYPPDVGGVSDYTRQVAEGLARTGEEVHVWCPRPAVNRGTAGVRVHPVLGSIRPSDLRRTGDQLDEFPAPRRLLVQWVPHGFGYHSMNLWFCLWLLRRSMAGDLVELMVHEAYSDFRRGPLRHVVMACVQRFMTALLMLTARRVWIATPSWERRLRAYALGRNLSITWLPVPGCVSPHAGAGSDVVRRRYASEQTTLIGHFGSFGVDVTSLLEAWLPAVMAHAAQPSLLLLGSGSDAYRNRLIEQHPHWATRIHSAGYVPGSLLAEHIAACDLFVQPYPDGITARRTTAMACLSQGRPVVTTEGASTEAFWSKTGAVALAGVHEPDACVAEVAALIEDSRRRQALGAEGRALYLREFDLSHVVGTLKAA
jgi:glycosyltransferase involved in cell wall biosynthesis